VSRRGGKTKHICIATLSTACRGVGVGVRGDLLLHVIDCGEEGDMLSCSRSKAMPIEIEFVYSGLVTKNYPNSEHGTQYNNEFC
jgi:hypothetical protein